MSEWTWRFETSDGAEITRDSLPVSPFPSQAEAESWVGESWPDLLAEGVDQVTLLCGGEIVYAAMSLRPPT